MTGKRKLPTSNAEPKAAPAPTTEPEPVGVETELSADAHGLYADPDNSPDSGE